MRRQTITALLLVACVSFSGAALAAREPYQECQLGYVKLSALYDKLFCDPNDDYSQYTSPGFWALAGEVDPEALVYCNGELDV